MRSSALPADREQGVVDDRFLVRREPSHRETERGRRAVQFPDSVALEHAERDIGQRLHAVRRGVAHLLLHADEVARQQEVQDLAPAIAERFVAKRPAAQRRVERRVGLAFVDDAAVGLHHDLFALERFDQRHFGRRVFVEQRQRTQRAGLAGHEFHADSLRNRRPAAPKKKPANAGFSWFKTRLSSS